VKEFYILIQPHDKLFGVSKTVKPSKEQKIEIASRIANEKAHVFKSKDKAFHGVADVKKYGGFSIFKDEDMQSKLAEMYESKNLDHLFKTQEINAKYSSDLDLSKGSSVFEWVKENVPDVGIDVDDESEEGYSIRLTEEEEDRINEYCNKYADVINEPKIEIYRGVKLNNIKNLDLKDIGMYWTFEKECADYYGSGKREPPKNAKLYVLTGIINPKNIEWEHGLTSFIWYGPDQWECALEIGTPVTIIAIDDEKLEKPLKAKVGKN
jgi:hypothetical protein